MDGRAEFDPKGLVWESFRIEGITIEECRSIFLDWALSLEALAPRPAIEALMVRHAADADDHPMKEVLRAGLTEIPAPGRRGGRRARVPD
jgi:hypothetical protein